jgi:hypothetical protein
VWRGGQWPEKKVAKVVVDRGRAGLPMPGWSRPSDGPEREHDRDREI